MKCAKERKGILESRHTGARVATEALRGHGTKMCQQSLSYDGDTRILKMPKLWDVHQEEI